ncbi:DUF2812 domain-containing protein [Exiguobacterium sp. Leaf196]|uniref:DUF2812 domain-containing protein n=1 Tax=Exiguobacterium sp. Leaf196 TaxID=1736298 RepID=UPI00070046B6|nr:DUF2812 domain-containing protein [Exiguobacterium sp. Leaf196]KQS45050.1 hypothetical protein ASG02_03130 [Exiguobacterium sp. Leaf196]
MSNKKTVYRFYADYAKEEVWLNEMANQGWYLQRFRLGCYEFIKGEPDLYTYRIELLEYMPKHPKSQEYFEFLEEMDIEVVDTSFRWVFLRKRTSNEPFHLYSDFDSQIHHEHRIMQLYKVVLFVNIIAVLINLFNPITDTMIWFNLAIVTGLSFVMQRHERKIQTLRGLRTIAEQD